MNKTLQKYLPLIILVAVLGVGIWYAKTRPQNTPEQPGNTQNNKVNNNTQGQTTTENPVASNRFAGTLKISDNLKRGNIMLAAPDHTVYMYTSRDYSVLFEKTVNIQIDGTLDNFRLIDITAK